MIDAQTMVLVGAAIQIIPPVRAIVAGMRGSRRPRRSAAAVAMVLQFAPVPERDRVLDTLLARTVAAVDTAA